MGPHDEVMRRVHDTYWHHVVTIQTALFDSHWNDSGNRPLPLAL
jgi:hypothetical protein